MACCEGGRGCEGEKGCEGGGVRMRVTKGRVGGRAGQRAEGRAGEAGALRGRPRLGGAGPGSACSCSAPSAVVDADPALLVAQDRFLTSGLAVPSAGCLGEAWGEGLGVGPFLLLPA